jgi:gliding motility-associated-like protein
MKIVVTILFIFIIGVPATAQNEVFIKQSDTINMPCSQNCVGISAQLPKPLHTNIYTVDSIPFAPVTSAGTSINFTSDDYFSDTISIGFTFCFFGNDYTQLVISDNGHITFNAAYANLPSSFNTQQALPAFNNALPDNAIYAPFLDSKLSLGGNLTYATLGVFPNRKFVISYNNIPYFNNNCNNTGNNTYQVILYEISNRIEFHITNKVVCNTDSTNWLNYATIGIQNTNASVTYTVPGKNASRWSASNKAYVFNPAGLPNYHITWLKNGSNILGTADSITYCPSSILDHITLIYYTNCPIYGVTDNIYVKSYKPNIDSIVVDKTTCINSNDGCITIYGTTIYPPLTYSVNGSVFSVTNPICGLYTTGYVVTIQDAQGCITSTSINVTSKSTLTGALDTMIADTCPQNGGVIAIHGKNGVAPYTYLWSTGSTDSMITNLVGDSTYNCVITDSLNCQKTVTYYVPRYGTPSVTKLITQPTCHASNGSILLTPTGNNQPYTYVWNNGQTTNPAINLAPNNYTVTVTSTNSCTRSYVYTTFDTLSTSIVIVNKINTKCGLANGKIIMTGVNAIAPYTYFINNTPLASNIADSLVAGTYIVKVVDANGCSKTSIVTIASSLTPIINFTSALPNCDSINGKLGTTIINGTPPYSYLWSNGSNATNLTNLNVGTYYITVIDSNGCVINNSITLNRLQPPHLQIVQFTMPLCNGDSNGSVTLNGIAGIPSYKYSLDSINFSAVAQIGNISAGTYTIFIKDASSCIRDTIVTFTQPSKITFNVSTIDTLVCYDDVLDSISIYAANGNPPYTYALNNNAYVAINQLYNVPIGNHAVYVKDKNNCIVSANILVPGPPSMLQNNLVKTDVPCYETNKGAITVNASGGWGNYTYSWSNGDTTAAINNLTAGKYVITIIDDGGCTITDSSIVDQLNCCTAAVPNVFTPNSIGPNNVLKVISGSTLSEVKFSIYNRYGEKVFETTSLNNGWNGMYKNDIAELGTYYFVLEYKCDFIKKKIRQTGDVLLLR